MLLQIITREIQDELQKQNPDLTIVFYDSTPTPTNQNKKAGVGYPHTVLRIKTKKHTYTITIHIYDTNLETTIKLFYPIKTPKHHHKTNLNDPNSIEQTVQFLSDRIDKINPTHPTNILHKNNEPE